MINLSFSLIVLSWKVQPFSESKTFYSLRVVNFGFILHRHNRCWKKTINPFQAKSTKIAAFFKVRFSAEKHHDAHFHDMMILASKGWTYLMFSYRGARTNIVIIVVH